MKVLILYFSEYRKQTEKIANIFAKNIDCDLINIKDFKDINIESYDLIGFGSGVYRESTHQKLYRLVEKLDLERKYTFVFSTSGVGMKFYNNGLIKLIESIGGINKGSFACKGSFSPSEFTDKKIFNFMGRLSQGHPNEKDLIKAEIFIRELIASL
ncbi:flavodoxin domain-containing protein [Tissierella sp.]|uniref:flavodoxin domain-containing protein n=1 Tax=Tissierella sp. TaxID=41274 RepID=UPI00285CF9F8|nr:flavodoxin domain-containing protein [Tissierella sp.]MDR7855954.1 flavodoxin domain-containing protein [Tissierella sp.]